MTKPRRKPHSEEWWAVLIAGRFESLCNQDVAQKLAFGLHREGAKAVPVRVTEIVPKRRARR